MFSIVKQTFSFVQFGNEIDGDIIPVLDPLDYAFQVLFLGTAEEAAALAASEALMFLVKNDAVITDAPSLAANTLIDFGADPGPNIKPILYRVAETKVLVYWPYGFPGFADVVSSGQCFKLCLKMVDSDANPVYYLSNSFTRITDEKFTSQLEYSCDDDAYDFIYCNFDIVNKIRFPLHLRRPQLQDEESVYVKSDRTVKRLKTVTRKEYEGVVDYLSELLHEKLKHALSHDNVGIAGFNYTGGISKNGNYEITWAEDVPEFDKEEAPAKFKAVVTPYNWRNTNCGECASNECEVSVTDVEITNTGGTPSGYAAEWVNAGGTPESFNVEVSLDGGATWQAPENLAMVDLTHLTYDLGTDDPTDHRLRITPVCWNSGEGEAGTADFLTDCEFIVEDFGANYNDGFFEFTWNNAAGIAASYVIEMSLDGGATWSDVPFQIDGSGEYGLADDAMANTARRFRLTPYCANGQAGPTVEFDYIP
jgi:hypothetical protein